MRADETAEDAARARYRQQIEELRGAFEAGLPGLAVAAARAKAVDDLISVLWTGAAGGLQAGIALVATGGYGRRQLFPYSDVDLLFLLDARAQEKQVKDAIRRLSQQMWDCGIRVSPATRGLPECERFDPENAELTLALMDSRLVSGDAELFERLAGRVIPKLLARDGKAITAELLQLTGARHAKYGETLFHLEPNIKDCPGGLRDVHVCGWLGRLQAVRAMQTNGKGQAEEVAGGAGGGGSLGSDGEFGRRWIF